MAILNSWHHDRMKASRHVDVRGVLFTVSDGRLLVALAGPCTRVALPHGIPRPQESLDAAASRVLATEIGGEQRYLEQLFAISQDLPHRWTVTVSYFDLAPPLDDNLPKGAGRWIEVATLPALDAIDAKIAEHALLRLRAKLGFRTIAIHLLPERFSLSELQGIYEVVLNRKLDKQNFRRRIHSGKFLGPTGETRRDGSHLPARLHRFRATHNAETYFTPACATPSAQEAATD